MKFTRSLTLPGKSPRSWKAELDDNRLVITAGAAKKPTVTEDTHGDAYAAQLAFVDALKKQLKRGYVLDGPHGALVSQFVAKQAAGSISPDGEAVWFATNDPSATSASAQVHSLSGALLETFDLGAMTVKDISDMVALSRDAVLIASGLVDVWKLEGGVLRVFAKLDGATAFMRVGGNRVLVRRHRQRCTLLDLEGREVATFEDVEHCALSDDGSVLVTCAHSGSELIIWNAEDGSERRRISLGEGRGVFCLAINTRHVVATRVYFSGVGRHRTLAFDLETGEPALTALFDKETSGHAQVLTSDGIVVINGAFHSGHERAPLVDFPEHQRPSGLGMRVASGGRFVSTFTPDGLFTAWDTTQLPSAAPPVVEKPKPKLAAPSTDWVVPPTPRIEVSDVLMKIAFAVTPNTVQSIRSGIIYSSGLDEVSTLVDLASFPPKLTSRMLVLDADRSAKGTFALLHRDGIWLTRDFGDRGDRVPLYGSHMVVRFLGEELMTFAFDGDEAPAIWRDGEWRPVTGLHTIDVPNGATTVTSSDGSAFVAYRQAAWRIDGEHRATKLFDMKGLNTAWTFPTSDGRCFNVLPQGTLVFFDPDGARLERDVVGKRKVSIGVDAMPGPDGTVLLSHANYTKNKTAFIGVLVPLSGGLPTPIPRVEFNTDASSVRELFMCGEEMLARIDDGVFHRRTKR